MDHNVVETKEVDSRHEIEQDVEYESSDDEDEYYMMYYIMMTKYTLLYLMEMVPSFMLLQVRIIQVKL
jgi:hypothetical protein